MKPRLKNRYETEIKPALKEKLGFQTVMRVPKLEKIVLNVGMGEAHGDPKAMEACLLEIGQITGQKPVKTLAKKSIAGFKVREGMVLGCKVTLRGNHMYEFLDRFINIALPRVRDLRGVNPKGFDGRGNYNLSVKEQIIFPEIHFDKIKTIYGINITFVTSTEVDTEAYELFRMFGMPYRTTGK